MSALPHAPVLRGQAPARLPNRTVLVCAAGSLAVVVAVAFLFASLAETPAPRAVCDPGTPCGQPPLTPPLENRASWRSSELGYRFQYSDDVFAPDSQEPRSVRLVTEDGNAAVLIEGAPAAETTPQTLFQRRLDLFRGNTLGLVDDPLVAHRILGPQIALHDGIAQTYVATLDSSQGPQEPIQLAIIAAGDSQTSVAVSVVVGGLDEGEREAIVSAADLILNTFRLKGDRVG